MENRARLQHDHGQPALHHRFLNAALGQQRKALVDIVQNVEALTAHGKSVAAHSG